MSIVFLSRSWDVVKLQLSVYLQVKVSESYEDLFSINATDKNPSDVITYSVSSAPDGVSVDSNGTISWMNVTYSSNDTFNIAVSDGKATTLFEPQIAICNCLNGGTLLYIIWPWPWLTWPRPWDWLDLDLDWFNFHIGWLEFDLDWLDVDLDWLWPYLTFTSLGLHIQQL